MTATLTVDGAVYRRWTAVRVKRGLKQCAGIFQIETPGEIDPPILPFAGCVLAADGEPLISGYVDEARIEIDARATRTRITGRSKTGQLVDCMDQGLPTNQFTRSPLDAIARAVAAPFGVGVVVGAGVNVGGPFADSTFCWDETVFSFLERLARQRGVLLTDDTQGNLVLATTGTATASAPLATGPGGNVFRARGVLSGHQRYSTYTVRSQAGMAVTGNGQTEEAIVGQAVDGLVPLYRPWAGLAESPLLQGDAQIRANWEAAHRLGAAVSAVLSVPEWRANGRLWQPNQLVHCVVPRLGLAGTMLIGAVEFREDDRGRRTDLTVAPPAAFQPEPVTSTSRGVAAGGWAGIPKVAAGAPSGAGGVNNVRG